MKGKKINPSPNLKTISYRMDVKCFLTTLPVQLILLQKIYKFLAIGFASSSAQQTVMKYKLHAIVTGKKLNFATTE